MFGVDLHLHTIVSDGTDSPAELLKKVREAGITVFSVTDHDAVKAAPVIRALLQKGDPRFIPGAEFSCRDERGKYHILGYGYDPASEPVQALIGRAHAIRMNKVRARLTKLKSDFGISFPEEEIAALLALDNPGKPHIGNLMVKYGYAESRSSAIKEVLDGIRVANEFLRPEEAIDAILAGGGIPALAHPFYGSGDELILGADMEERLIRLTRMGLRGLEAFYSGFSLKLHRAALELAERFDLYVTAGSDYHGTNKLVRLGDTGPGEAEPPAALLRFLEDVAS